MARSSIKIASTLLALSLLRPGLADDATTKVEFEVYPPNAKVYVQRVNEKGWDYLDTAEKPILLSKRAHFNNGSGIFQFRDPNWTEGQEPDRDSSEEKSIAWTKLAGDKTFETGLTLRPRSAALQFQDWRHFTPWSDAALVGLFLLVCCMGGAAVWLLKQNKKRKEEEAHLEALALKGISPEMRVGNYYRLNRIGQGGGGSVYRAVPVNNPAREASVALKMLDANIGYDHEFKERFRREIDATARLVHPNVITIHEADEVQDGSELHGTLYYVMDLLEGISLETYMNNQASAIEPSLVGDYVSQAAAGLHHAHIKQLVHRDVKGDNLILTKDKRVVVIDFGLARKPKQTIQLTRDSNIPGSTLYMPPESALIATIEDEAKFYTQAYDQFALAILAFELLTRQRPFVCEQTSRNIFVVDSIEFQSIRSVKENQPQLCEEFDVVFQRALSRDPSARYPTIADFAEALKKVCEKQSALSTAG